MECWGSGNPAPCVGYRYHRQLGRATVDTFLRDARFTKVYALNRPSNGEKDIKTRHEERSVDKGLVSLLSDDRLVFLEGDASSGGLTVDQEVWNIAHTLDSSSFRILGARSRQPYHS